MGNNACLLIGYHDMVRALMYVQIILYWNNLLIQLFIIRMMGPRGARVVLVE
jgi:hypothetical protein